MTIGDRDEIPMTIRDRAHGGLHPEGAESALRVTGGSR